MLKRLLACLSLAVTTALGAAETPGWAVHYYGGPSFRYHAAAASVPGPALALDLNQVKWPPPSPTFKRWNGWSVAAYARLRVPKEGEYRFAVEPGKGDFTVSRLEVNGRLLDDAALAKPVALPEGDVPIALYLKPRANPTTGPANHAVRSVLWQAPGADKLSPVPVSHGAAELGMDKVMPPDIPLDYAQGEEVRYAERRFNLDLPESGLYEVAAHFSGVPRQFQVWLDGLPLLYVQGDRHGITTPLYGATDMTGATDTQRLDFFHRARAVRPLSSGKHTLDVYAHYGPWIWNDEMKEAMQSFSLGVTKMDGRDPLRSLAVYPKDRDDMVFALNKPLTLSVRQASDAKLRLEVFEERGAKTPVWTAELEGRGEFEYPCSQEGAFEYRVVDGDGRVVDGPWAFAVADPTPAVRKRLPAAGMDYPKTLVDSVDCALSADSGHVFRDNGTSKVVDSPVGKYRVTGEAKTEHAVGYVKDGAAWRRAKEGEKPEASFTTADWFAYTLKVKNPGRPHLLVATIPNDIPRLVSVFATDQVTGEYNGWNLNAGDAPESGPFSQLAFAVWPNGKALDVMSLCSNGNHGYANNRQGAVAKLELFELPDGLPELPEAAGGWNQQAQFGWTGEQVNLGPMERTMPSLWDDNAPISGHLPRWARDGAFFHDWKAVQQVWTRFGELSACRGDNLVIYPVQSYGMNFLQGKPARMLPKMWDLYSKGWPNRVVDPMERDIFKFMLMAASKRHVGLAADFMIHRMETIVPQLAKEAGTSEEGILLSADASGKAWRPVSEAYMLNPAHPAARKYFVALMDALGERYGSYPAFAGVRIRQWVGWPSALDGWFVNDKTGCDDFTVGLFCQETGAKLDPVKGDEQAYQARRAKLLGELREQWLSWRCQKVLTLREEMLAALRKHAPRARLFSGNDLGPGSREGGLDPKLLADRQDLGWGKGSQTFGGDQSTGVEMNNPDPVEFANFDQRQPESLHRSLENLVPGGATYPQLPCCNQSIRPHPYQLEGPALALAKGDLETCFYGGQWCIPPADEGLRRFVQAWRAIPELKYTRFLAEGGANAPITCWQAKDDGLVVYLVNRTAKPREAVLTFDVDMEGARDLVSGKKFPAGRRLRVQLSPFMPAVFKVEGVESIESLEMPMHLNEVAELGRSLDVLRAMRPKAQGVAQPVQNGEDEADSQVSFDTLYLPVEAAWKADQPHEAARLLLGFNKDHLWWYEAFGWPEGFYVPALTGVGQAARGTDLKERLHSPGAFKELKPFKGEFLTAPRGAPVPLRFNPSYGAATLDELRVWGLFGGGYGPITVKFLGQTIGQLGADGGAEPQLVHRLLPVPLKFPWSPQEITLIGEGVNGLAIQQVAVKPLPATPITHWMAIGLFDKGLGINEWEHMERPFPPEEKLDFAASYPGLNGTQAKWRPVECVKRLDMLDLFPYDNSKGDGVAYLATWIKAPTRTKRALAYSMDWFGKAWMNGKLVSPKISGPANGQASVEVELQPGWNCLLVKTATGTAGWKAGFAVADLGDLEFSGVPPTK